VSRISWLIVPILAVLIPTTTTKEASLMTAAQNEPRSVRFVNPPTLAPPPGYTHVVTTRGGRTVYIAGQVALDAEGNLVGAGDIGAQAEQVFQNLQHALEAVGANFGNVVKFGIYVTDFSEVGALRQIRDRYIDVEHPPASTAVGVKRLFREDFLIEIDAIAVVPDEESGS
jgi:2-iminobutanoate/2-iminopropanoate deaminase